jgi:putative restriction endonuclease
MSNYEYGHLPGIDVGQIFKDRKELSQKRIHGPTQAGIWGSQTGACSIVLSGGYEDDIDELDFIYYTGQGGQNSSGKQIDDQKFTRGNEGLRISCDYNLPIRVTRGFQIKNGPISGYRYDGIYYVKKYERVEGRSGFLICRYTLESEKTFEILENEIKNNLKPDYIKAKRKQLNINTTIRDTKLGESIKKIYSYRCQVCDVYLKTPNQPVAIGAHIKGLGRPHNGPDILENMLCLCPNHHDQFDKYSFYIDYKTLKIKELEGYKNLKLNLNQKHKLDREFLKYHYENYLKNNPTQNRN